MHKIILHFSILLGLLCPVFASAQSQALPAGWSMVGNDTGAAINADAVFGNTTTPTAISPSVTTVWTWNNAQSQWNFFSPSMSAQQLSTYAASKGYGVLSSIAKGEGFWVNAKNQFMYDPSVTAVVTNVAPVANAGVTQHVVAGSVVTLDGSASSDANGDSLTYAWTLTSKPAGSTAALSSATSAKPSFTADVVGTYVLSLVVNDGKASSAPATLAVAVGSPTATYKWSAGSPVYAAGAMSAFMPAIASLSNGKLIAVYAQSESNGNKVYATVGSYETGTWNTPVALTGSVGSVQGVSNSSGWNQPTPATVVAANAITGNALVAWTTQVAPESSYRVWVSSFNASNNTWGNAAQIGVAIQAGLKATSSEAGGMAIAWLKSSTAVTGNAALGIYMSSSSGVITSDELELGVKGAVYGLKIGLSNTDMLAVVWSGINQQVMLARSGTTSWSVPVVAGEGNPSEDANIDLAVAPDGSGAAVWSGLDPSIHTAVFDVDGTITANTLRTTGSVGNLRPAVAVLGSGKFIIVFATSSSGGTSSLYYDLATSVYDPLTGWTNPVDSNYSDVGYSQIRVSGNGVVMALTHGYNQHAYVLSSGGAVTSSYMHYNGSVPAFAMEAATGRAAFLWSNGQELVGDFYR